MTFRLITAVAVLCAGELIAETSQLIVVQEKAPLFKEKSISSPIIKYLEKGSALNLLAAEDSFYLVSYGGFEGWVIPFSVQPVSGEPQDTVSAGRAAVGEAQEKSADKIVPGRYLVVTNRYANIREGPGTNYKKIDQVNQGARLEKFIKRGNWYRVRLPNSKIGFIREDLVKESSEVQEGSGAVRQGASSAPERTVESLEAKVDRLERELREIRSLLLEHIRESRRAGGELGAGKALPSLSVPEEGNKAGLDFPGAIQESSRAKIIGNTATRVYHLPGSKFYDKIPEEFRVYFDSEDQAQKAGYTKSIR